ncbi:uncharacterized protein LOC142334323 isoform X2 [Lycorma delicatula]|uniref:uncharacterized protein LOC142334323 isoform X2 n=1 Tax=Lycorma delicatula TaxID=130591 RepID=UPI003F510002
MCQELQNSDYISFENIEKQLVNILEKTKNQKEFLEEQCWLAQEIQTSCSKRESVVSCKDVRHADKKNNKMQLILQDKQSDITAEIVKILISKIDDAIKHADDVLKMANLEKEMKKVKSVNPNFSDMISSLNNKSNRLTAEIPYKSNKKLKTEGKINYECVKISKQQKNFVTIHGKDSTSLNKEPARDCLRSIHTSSISVNERTKIQKQERTKDLVSVIKSKPFNPSDSKNENSVKQAILKDVDGLFMNAIKTAETTTEELFDDGGNRNVPVSSGQEDSQLSHPTLKILSGVISYEKFNNCEEVIKLFSFYHKLLTAATNRKSEKHSKFVLNMKERNNSLVFVSGSLHEKFVSCMEMRLRLSREKKEEYFSLLRPFFAE